MNIWIKIIAIALISGILGFLTKFPIGALLGTLIVIGFIQIKTNKLPQLPLKVKRIFQALFGGSLGLTFSNETIELLSSPNIWLVALLTPILHLAIALMLTFILYYFFKFDLITALCCTAPAGIGEIVILSEKYNATQSSVITTHLSRMLIIIVFIPIILVYI